MNHKEKARELVDRFISAGCLFANAKKCALICIDEIIKTFEVENLLPNSFDYWNKVKQEIKKL